MKGECLSSIVECLREAGKEPIPFASSFKDEHYKPENALVYDENLFYAPRIESMNQWWAVDFTEVVAINSYKIKSGTNAKGGWIDKWVLYSSLNNRTWKEISTLSAGTPGDNMYVLRKVMNARFIRINGSSQYTDPTYFGFYYIKFYGSLSPVADVSCMRRKRIDAIAFQMIFLVASKMF